MFVITVVRSAFHVAVLAFDTIIRFGAFPSLAHDAAAAAFVFLSIAIVYEAFFAEVAVAEESSDARDGVEVVIVYQVEVDTGSLIRTGTGDKLITQSSTDHHHAHS